MTNEPTLLRILRNRARTAPQQPAFTFFKEKSCTYAQLWQQSSRVACFLRSRGLGKGDKAVIAIPNSQEFVYAFLGVWLAGGVAVPVFPGSGSQRLLEAVRSSDAVQFLFNCSFPETKLKRVSLLGNRRGPELIAVEKALQNEETGIVLAGDTTDPALIQFTSGSTRRPRGAVISHGNLVTNILQMQKAMKITEADIFVSWLPMYHDMGLVLMLLLPLYLGLPLFLLPGGISYLETWMQTIARKRATFTAAPDFAYRLCLVYLRKTASTDLSSLRVALNAAEPVRYSTIRRFEHLFALKNVMLPAYGLAEATVGVSCWEPGAAVEVDSKGNVSAGKPFQGIKIKICSLKGDPGPNNPGEIRVLSPAACSGYYGDAAATARLFDLDKYIRTGDMGYCDFRGNLFVVGRKKNIIIQGGHNIASREIEELIDALSWVRRCAAVGIETSGVAGEQACILIEVPVPGQFRGNDTYLRTCYAEAVAVFKEYFGFAPGPVLLLKTGSIPLTTNGKICYPEIHSLFSQGFFKDKAQLLFPQRKVK